MLFTTRLREDGLLSRAYSLSSGQEMGTVIVPGIERKTKMATKAVTDATFDSEIIKSDKPVVVDFWAEWCGPCKQIGPALEELSDDFAGDVEIAKINIDENPEAPGRLGVRSIPTLMIFQNGELKATRAGSAPKSALSAWISQELGLTAKTA